MSKLIVETIFKDLQVTEAVDKNGVKQLYVEGIYAQAEKKNRNGRIYPDRILDREVKRFIKEKVNQNRALGELEHPECPEVQLERASHRIVSMRKEGSDWIGKAVVLNTPCGQIVRGLLEGGTTIGVSTRGLGSVIERRGYNEIAEDFHLVTVDIVGDPSGIDCFVNGIMEGVEWEMTKKGVFTKRERGHKLDQAKRFLSEKHKLGEIEKFLTKLSQA